MNRITSSIVTLLLALPALAAPDAPAAAPDLSPEQAVLQRRVGTWDNVTTIKPGVWVPKGSEAKTVETIRWILGRSFIEGNARETTSPLVSNHLMGYDPVSKRFHMWYFDSTGNFPHSASVGQWDAATQTLHFAATLPDGVANTASVKFVDADHADWTATWTGKDGMVLMEIVGKQVRHQGAAADEVTPSKVAAPDPAGPPELKHFAGFPGDWNAEVRDNSAPQPAWNPADSNHKTWTLGGRFVRDEVRNAQGEMTMLGLWTYDATEKTHREWYFFADGNVLEAVAGWDEATSTLSLDGKLLRGGTLRGPCRLTGPDAYTWDGIIRDDAGQTLADLSGRQERMKP